MTTRHPSAALAVAGRRSVRPHLAPPLRECRRAASAPSDERHNGGAGDVLLQGFHRRSCESQSPSWRVIVAQNAEVIKNAGFDMVWLPPPSASADDLGYLPTRWNVFDNHYGSRAELLAAIAALRPVKAIADVVVNHRCGVNTAGVDFNDPAFPDQNAAVCVDDECGQGTGHPDTGENQPAARDLDHLNSDVQAAIVGYLKELATLGFEGFRFDEAKGYAGQFLKAYTAASNLYFAVGEFWSGDRQEIMNWIDATGGHSMAFDFPTRVLLKSAVASHAFGSLKTIDGKPTGALGWWPAMCVTFLDNHDTEGDAFGSDDQLLMGYAYTLTHPGIPCVYWPHFFDYGPTIRAKISALVAARNDSGVNRDSVVDIVAANDGLYAALVTGSDGDVALAMKLGSASWDPGPGFTLVMDGNDVAVWRRD